MMNLAAEMARLPEPKTDLAPPHWEYWRWDLWRRAQQDKPENFTKWPCVRHTMLVDHWWPGPMLQEVEHVTGIPNVISSKFNVSDSRNLIHQAYHILRWQDVTGKRIADMQSIYEFGGGYGAMALVCNRLGFKGDYYIYDLPEFVLLQRWYLGEHDVTNVKWVGHSAENTVDLFIACYSLSETNYNNRDYTLQRMKSDNYLFLYSAKWEEYDNQEYFSGLDFGKTWAHEHIKHLPPESWYTWGW